MDTRNRLREFREAAGLSQDECCDRLQSAAQHRLGVEVHPTRELVSKYERGVKPVSRLYRRLFCELYRATETELGLIQSPAVRNGAAETVALTVEILSPSIDSSVIDSIENSTHTLSRAYPRESPVTMLPRVQEQLRLVRDLLRNSSRLPDHTRLLNAAGWQCLLLAMIHYDLTQYEAGQTSRDAALYLGEQISNADLIGWAYEASAWFAIYKGSPQDVLDAAEEGSRRSPPGSAAELMNVLKMGVGWARLGQRLEAERAVDRAVGICERMADPPYPDHHFMFDRPKLDLYVARIYAFLRMPSQAQHHARRVLDQVQVTDNRGRFYPVPPTRESFGRLDLASALIDGGEVEEACTEATRAFGVIMRDDVLQRAGEIDARLRTSFPRLRPVRDYHERYMQARWMLSRTEF